MKLNINDNPEFDKWNAVKGDKYFDNIIMSEKEKMFGYLNKALLKDRTDAFEKNTITHYDEDLIDSFNAEYNQYFRNLIKSTKSQLDKNYDTLEYYWDIYFESVYDLELFDSEGFYKEQFIEYLKQTDEKKYKDINHLFTTAIDKKKKGAPTHRNQKADLKLKRDWEQSRDAKISKADFCADEGISIRELDNALRNCHPDRLN